MKLSQSAVDDVLRTAGKASKEITVSTEDLQRLSARAGTNADSLSSVAPKLQQSGGWTNAKDIVKRLYADLTDPEGAGGAIKFGCLPFDEQPKTPQQLHNELLLDTLSVPLLERGRVQAAARELHTTISRDKVSPDYEIRSAAFWFCFTHDALP
ncbi:hypothetical protein [Arthrobacter sp. ISL-69]|uniref:hypothetical protein n=1 Tax=Arthrobacter sp. ISL-69 TaxID=2819113 RepID=UPI001BE66531|nr:hypothetical protein [Arthrobacter sp. ISL-69]MBT2538945.1 hypothetical protein [Arthrobacter sp. ISL-69]